MAVKNNREGAKPAKIKKRFVRYREGAELYSMSERFLILPVTICGIHFVQDCVSRSQM